MSNLKYPRIGITSGMSGHFAVLYDEDGPIETGVGRYKTSDEAKIEAKSWALSDEYPLDDYCIKANRNTTHPAESRK